MNRRPLDKIPGLRIMACMVAVSLSSAFCLDAATESSKPSVGKSSYKGWNSVCLENSLVQLHVVPAIGGRVIQYRLGDKEFMWVNAQLAGQVSPSNGLAPDGGWLNYGADKLWPAPQGWDNDKQWPGPPDAVLDGSPYEIEMLPADGNAVAVRLTSGDDKRSGIRFSRVVRLHKNSTHVSFEATMKNIDSKPRRWGIWSHTQLDGGRKEGGHNGEMNAYCPLNQKSHFPKGYSVIFGDDKNPSFQPDPARGLMRVEYRYRVGKIGLDSDAGWIATVDGSNGRVFVQRFVFEAGKEYPDGSSVEFWLNGLGSFRAWGKDNVMSDDPVKNPYIFESEMISPFAELKPGESYTWKYDWYATSIGGNYPVVNSTRVGITAEPLCAKAEGERARISGRFGVFCPGILLLTFLDAQGKVISSEKLPGDVSPLQPVILDQLAKIPAGAAGIRLSLHDFSGSLIGELANLNIIR